MRKPQIRPAAKPEVAEPVVDPAKDMPSAERIERMEKVIDSLCERLVIAQKHMTHEQRLAFEKEWQAFMLTGNDA